MPVTDPAARLAALEDAALLTLHKRLDDTSTPEDPAAVEAHHLVTVEMLKRGIDHGHEEDAWANAVILVDEVVVKSVDDLDMPAEMTPVLEAVLIDGGTVTVLLTADGYVMKAEGDPAGGSGPTVNAVHVDSIMGAYPIRRRKRKRAPEASTGAPVEVEKAKEWRVDDFVTWQASGGEARGRIEKIVEEGSINVPDSSFTIKAEPDDPAVLIRVYRLTSQGFRPTETLVGHKASTLRSIGAVQKAEGYDVPEDVQSAAKQALEWISDGRAGDGFTSVGRNRARQLADGGPVGRDTLVKMRAYFARHVVDKQADGWGDKSDPTPGMVAWYAWGGDAGRAWANRVLASMDKAYDPESALTPKQKALYDAYEMVAEQHGEFTPDEAHYMCADDNPFQDRGMACANCVFYDGGGGCEILTEQVEAMALCKLWVIPDDLIAVDEEELLETMDVEDLAGFAAYAWLDDEGDVDMEKAGNPEPLRDYWRAGGKGKINWGAGGDFTACVAAVSKYMTSEEAKGYCAIRHREVTGMWPGDKRNRPAKKSVTFTTSSASTLTLPDGATYTFTVPVEKHGNHNQQSHAGHRGGVATIDRAPVGSPGLGSDVHDLIRSNLSKGQIADEYGSAFQRGSQYRKENPQAARAEAMDRIGRRDQAVSQLRSIKGRTIESESLAGTIADHQGFIDGALGRKASMATQAGFGYRVAQLFSAGVSGAEKAAEPVLKHPGHGDQSVHNPHKGGRSGVPDLVADQPPIASRSPEGAAEAIALRKRAEELEPEITGKITSMVTERGGTMEGLEQRLKTTDSLARKIDADAEAEYGGDRAAAAANISDAVRYTAVIGDAQYTDGARTIIRDLEKDGYTVRAKNFWQKGDDYQGINIKATKNGVTVELQLHTPTSLDVKEGRSTKGTPIRSLHDSYEVLRTSSSKSQRWKAWTGMVRLASQIPVPHNYEALLGIGTLALKSFE